MDTWLDVQAIHHKVVALNKEANQLLDKAEKMMERINGQEESYLKGGDYRESGNAHAKVRPIESSG